MLLLELERFIREDIGEDDDSCGIVPAVPAKAEIVCKENGVLAGLDEARQIFQYFGLDTKTSFADGNQVKPDDAIMSIQGSAADILRGERLAL
ncbi:MAG TPA: nicotinate-nucleotide diphosphorylase (carboxylating), partial [Methanocella sp.]|nr:nicotinate-nucleotide diphosphorylase (carboxylating) [Methanocella sp.]